MVKHIYIFEGIKGFLTPQWVNFSDFFLISWVRLIRIGPIRREYQNIRRLVFDEITPEIEGWPSHLQFVAKFLMHGSTDRSIQGPTDSCTKYLDPRFGHENCHKIVL